MVDPGRIQIYSWFNEFKTWNNNFIVKVKAKITDNQPWQDSVTSVPKVADDDTYTASGENIFPFPYELPGAAHELNLKSQTVTTASTPANTTDAIEVWVLAFKAV